MSSETKLRFFSYFFNQIEIDRNVYNLFYIYMGNIIVNVKIVPPFVQSRIKSMHLGERSSYSRYRAWFFLASAWRFWRAFSTEIYIRKYNRQKIDSLKTFKQQVRTLLPSCSTDLFLVVRGDETVCAEAQALRNYGHTFYTKISVFLGIIFSQQFFI